MQTPNKNRLLDLHRVVDALAEVMSAGAIGEWISTPNGAFNLLKPLEVIERGEIDRIWRMIFVLRSGTPS